MTSDVIFDAAFAYLMTHESANLYEDKSTGEVSKYGISLKWMQDNKFSPPPTKETVIGLSDGVAKVLYRQFWWQDGHFDLIAAVSPRIAIKVFDHAVNMGARMAIVILQRVLAQFGETLSRDGEIGPDTAEDLKLVLTPGPVEEVADLEHLLLCSLCSRYAARYTQIAAANKNLAKDLSGWLKRAGDIPPETA